MAREGIGTKTARAPEKAAARRKKRVLVSLWMNGVFGQDIVEGIHERLGARGLSWDIRFVDSPDSFASTILWMMRKGMIDGVATSYHDSPLVGEIRRAGIPTVLLESDPLFKERVSPVPGTAFVWMDFAALGREAVDHFVSRAGFRSAGFVENFWDRGWSRRRGDAVLSEFRRRGLSASRFLHHGAFSTSPATRAPDFDGLAAWLRALEKPAAVVAANDATGVDVLLLCAAAGLAVPRDIAVLGMDDNPVHCLHCDPNLSSIHFDGRQAGRLCVDALENLMSGAPPPDRPLFYGVETIARRASTGAVSTAGALVQKALDYIDANACRGISLADVVRHLGVSRSLATQRFRELRGESILAAIRSRRVAEAKRLLSGTAKPLDEIAEATGFPGGADCLRRAFAAETGTTPAAWRTRAGRMA